MTGTSTSLVVKAPGLPVTAAGGLAFFSEAAVPDIVSHRGMNGPTTQSAATSMQLIFAPLGQNKRANVPYMRESEPDSGGHCEGEGAR